MEKIEFQRKDFVLLAAGIFICLILFLGFGYFLGSYEQIRKNKSLLQTIPDVNCGSFTVKNPL